MELICCSETVWLYVLEVSSGGVEIQRERLNFIRSFCTKAYSQPSGFCALVLAHPKMGTELSSVLKSSRSWTDFLPLFSISCPLKGFLFEFVSANHHLFGRLLPIYSIFNLGAYLFLSWFGFRNYLPFTILFVSSWLFLLPFSSPLSMTLIIVPLFLSLTASSLSFFIVLWFISNFELQV